MTRLMKSSSAVVLRQFAGAGRAILEVAFEGDHLAHGQFAIVKGCEPPTYRRAGQQPHTSLNSARRASRALASRDLTVPTAMPSENPISS